MAYTVRCPSCSTEFPVDPDKVPRDGVNARCSSCAEVFFVERPTEGEEGGPVTPESPVEIPREEAPGFEESVVGAEEEVEPEAGIEEGAGEELERELEQEAFPEEAGEPAFADTPEAAPPEFSSEAAAPEEPEEIAGDDFVLEQETLYTEEEEEEGGAPLEEPEAGLELEEPAEETAATAEETPAEETPSGEAPAGLAGTGTAAEPAGPAQFGQRSPEEKAERLARVLVSDMILYNPQRHTRAMENGTLAEEFEDEIEKSWEEYVEQVGEELAENTSYFTEALNEILAKGEEIF